MTVIQVDTDEEILSFVQTDPAIDFHIEVDDYGRLIIMASEKLVAAFNSERWNYLWVEDGDE